MFNRDVRPPAHQTNNTRNWNFNFNLPGESCPIFIPGQRSADKQVPPHGAWYPRWAEAVTMVALSTIQKVHLASEGTYY